MSVQITCCRVTASTANNLAYSSNSTRVIISDVRDSVVSEIGNGDTKMKIMRRASMRLSTVLWATVRTTALAAVSWVYAMSTPSVQAICANACDYKVDTKGNIYGVSCITDGSQTKTGCSISNNKCVWDGIRCS